MSERYYTPEIRARLIEAQTFRTVGDIAIEVIESMPHNGHIIMCAGPITTGGKGDPVLNMATLRKAITRLEDRGHLLFNQLPLETATGRLWHAWKAEQERKPKEEREDYCHNLLIDIYLRVFQTGRLKEIRFLPDWQSSTGAVWEYNQAEKHGIIRSYFSVNWEDEVNVYV